MFLVFTFFTFTLPRSMTLDDPELL